MDIITAILKILFILWIIALVRFGRRKPQVSAVTQELAQEEEIGVTEQLVQGETLEVKLPQGGEIRVYPRQVERQKEEKIPEKANQRGKFPAWVNGLSEKELFDLLSAAVKDRTELLIKLGLGGETFWFSGYRTDEGFICSNDGTDLFPLTFYYN
jgi:hypothetical protein